MKTQLERSHFLANILKVEDILIMFLLHISQLLPKNSGNL